MTVLSWRMPVEFLSVTIALYLLLRWGKQARALRIALAVLALWIAGSVARQLGLFLTGLVLHVAAAVAVLILVVLFQSELRFALGKLDLAAWVGRRRFRPPSQTAAAISSATFSLAKSGRGALLVLVGRDPVAELVTGGVPLGGRVSEEILEAIFRKVSPVHDGATVIQGDQILTVSAILPLTLRSVQPRRYGTRHRAALGLSERCDATVIVVSEERGEVSVARAGGISAMRTPEELFRSLSSGENAAKGVSRLRHALTEEWRLKLAALAMAALVVWVMGTASGSVIHTVIVPVEFANLPSNLIIAEQSPTVVTVRLRELSLYASSAFAPTARIDLAQAVEGEVAVAVDAGVLNLPPGVTVDGIWPNVVRLRLTKR